MPQDAIFHHDPAPGDGSKFRSEYLLGHPVRWNTDVTRAELSDGWAWADDAQKAPIWWWWCCGTCIALLCCIYHMIRSHVRPDLSYSWAHMYVCTCTVQHVWMSTLELSPPQSVGQSVSQSVIIRKARVFVEWLTFYIIYTLLYSII